MPSKTWSIPFGVVENLCSRMTSPGLIQNAVMAGSISQIIENLVPVGRHSANRQQTVRPIVTVAKTVG
jgi:hypothetical protein